MTAEELKKLAVEFIKTEAGKKAIGIDLDINNLKKQAGDTLQTLTPEQIENRTKQYTPEIEEYTINGRIYDETTNNPIPNAKITPILATGKKVQTNKQGQFSITLGIPILPYNQKALVQTQLLVSANGYPPSNLEVLTGERLVKTDLKTKPLINIEAAAKSAADELRREIQSKIDQAKNISLSISDKVIVVRRTAIYQLTNSILFKLLPLGVGLLTIFGVTKISQLKDAVCPTEEQLKQVVQKRNRIVRQLNQIYVMVAVNTALAGLFAIIAANLQSVKKTISNLSFPVSVPPGVGVPYSLISKLEDVKKTLDTFTEQNKKLNKQLLVALIFLVAALIILLSLIKAVDEIVLKCSQNSNLNLDELNQELRELEKETENNAVSATTQINGFTIEVQNVDQNAIGDYKRRQAVGKNAQGVIILKGDPSFSAEDTVLINELAYYIQSNDLKAF